MFENIREQMDMYVCSFEITINGVIQKQTVEAPRIILEQQFLSLMEQAYQDPRPVKIRMSVPIKIWDPFEKRFIRRENSVSVENIAYVNMEEK